MKQSHGEYKYQNTDAGLLMLNSLNKYILLIPDQHQKVPPSSFSTLSFTQSW